MVLLKQWKPDGHCKLQSEFEDWEVPFWADTPIKLPARTQTTQIITSRWKLNRSNAEYIVFQTISRR